MKKLFSRWRPAAGVGSKTCAVLTLQNITECVMFCKAMQSVLYLESILEQVSSKNHFLYSKSDLRNLFPGVTEGNFNMLLSRAVGRRSLERVCKGIYVYTKVPFIQSEVLCRTAAKLRSSFVSYISLETVLSENSLISQQMPGWVTIMTTGRSGIILCGRFGTVEFVHTAKSFGDIAQNLFLDKNSGMLKARPAQAYRDMVSSRRTTLGLVDLDGIKELPGV